MDKLKYSQYFIDTSNDYNKTGNARFNINYISVPYEYKNKTFEANYEVHYEKDRNIIQVNFQETNGKLDWVCNFLFLDKYYDSFTWNNKKIVLKVHNGWAAMYKALKHIIRNKISVLLTYYPDAEIEIVGWSLGSALAQLCAQDINYNLNKKVYLFTYGSVNPWKVNIFNKRKIRQYLQSCCSEVKNFANVNDIVTYLPPRIFGFTKIKKTKIGKPFLFWRLFNPGKYHTIYCNDKFYKNIL